MPQLPARGAARQDTPAGLRPDRVRPLLVGGVLAATAALVLLLDAALGLDLETVALLGLGVGAVVALVPDRTPAERLAGALAGAGLAWVGYLARAAVLPDTAGGRAVAAAVVLLLAAALAAALAPRLPLWTLLVGVAGFVGAYETSFDAAPALVADTSVTAATSVALAAAIGFLAAHLVTGATARAGSGATTAAHAQLNAPAGVPGRTTSTTTTTTTAAPAREENAR